MAANLHSYKTIPARQGKGLLKLLSGVVVLFAFFAACMIYGVGFMAVLLNARPMAVTSGSMMPAVNQGDALIVRPAGPESILVGDIITFQNFGRQNFTTHRVIGIRQVAGSTWYQTKGDANPVADQDLTPHGAVLGKVKVVLPRVGYLLAYVATPRGVLTMISFPLLIMLVQELLLFGAGGRRKRGAGSDAVAHESS